jgi:hypothetical protein
MRFKQSYQFTEFHKGLRLSAIYDTPASGFLILNVALRRELQRMNRRIPHWLHAVVQVSRFAAGVAPTQ